LTRRGAARGSEALGSLRAAVLYVALTFAAGALLGPLRELVLAPRIGRDAALLVEAPLLLAAIALAARFVTRRLAVPADLRHRLPVGALALILLLAIELSLGALVRGLTVAAQISAWATPFGAVTWLLYLAFATMPALLLWRLR
jgi:hypothetical protein